MGLFSLSLLPMFCIWYIDKRGVFDDLRALEITWWNKDWYGYVQNPPNFDVHPRREFIDIYLTGNVAEDKVKLDFAQLAIRELIATNDTIKGIHFNFGDTAKYSTFVQALNILTIEKAPTYTPYKNDIWVFNIPRLFGQDVIIPNAFCSTSYQCTPIILESTITPHTTSNIYILSIVFAFLLVLPATLQLRGLNET